MADTSVPMPKIDLIDLMCSLSFDILTSSPVILMDSQHWVTGAWVKKQVSLETAGFKWGSGTTGDFFYTSFSVRVFLWNIAE